MKAVNNSEVTGHNRTIRLTEIGGKYLQELDIIVMYREPVASRVDAAVTLDNEVIPTLIRLINVGRPS